MPGVLNSNYVLLANHLLHRGKDMKPTQVQMFYQAQEQIAQADQHFMDMIKDPVNPLTNADLAALVEKYPQRWSRYSGYIGKLSD